MKKNVKLLSSLFIISTMFLNSCGKVPYSQMTEVPSETPEKELIEQVNNRLSSPENLSFDKATGSLKWDIVPDAYSYVINVDGKDVLTVVPVVETTTFDFSLFSETIEGTSKKWNQMLVDATNGKVENTSLGYVKVSKGAKFIFEVNDSAIVTLDAKTGIIDETSEDKSEVPAKYEVSDITNNKIVVTANDDFNLYSISVTYESLVNSVKATLDESILSSDVSQHLVSVRAVKQDESKKSNYTSIIVDLDGDESNSLYKLSLNEDEESLTVTSIDVENEQFKADVVIPEKIVLNNREYPITKIGDYAFYENKKVTSVTLPNSIVEIGMFAFSKVSKLKSVTLNEGLKVIGESAFYNKSAAELTLPSSVEEIKANAFESSSVKTLTIPENSLLHTIGDSCFKAAKFKSIYIPKGLVNYGVDAFRDCALEEITFAEDFEATHFSSGCFAQTSIKKFTLPLSIKEISPSLFESSKLTHFFLPAGHTITEIGDSAFEKCSNLAYFGNYSDDEEINGLTSKKCRIVIPSEIISIGARSFKETKVVDLDLTNAHNLETINESAFESRGDKATSFLKKVVFNDSLKYIYANAFAKQINLSEIVFSANSKIQCIDSTTFKDTAFGKTDLFIKDGIENQVILGNVLIQLSSEDQIRLGLIKKEDFKEGNPILKLFDKEEEIKKTPYVIPSNILGITNNLYANSNISNITLPSKLIHIGSGAFKNCNNITSVNIPDTVNNIDDEAFDNCSNIESLSLGNVSKSSLKEIGNNAFRGVSKVKSISLPDNVNSIGSFAFSSTSQSQLKTFNITNNSKLEEIGASAFLNNKLLESFNLPVAVKVLEDEVFSGCSSLAYINIDLATSQIESIGSSCFAGTAIKNINIPNSIQNIGIGAFKDCSSLESVTFGENAFVNSDEPVIRESTFENCVNLHSIILPDAITTIDAYAFAGASLKENVSSKASKIHKDAFKNSYFEQSFEDGVVRVGSVLLSYHGDKEVLTADDLKGITSINPNAFDANSVVKSITLPESLEYIDENAFDGCLSLQYVYADANCKLNKIAANAFKDCQNLLEVNIPSMVDTIEGYAFYNCFKLREVNFNTTLLASIPEYCFANCNSLEAISLPFGINVIDSYAFYQTALKEVKLSSSIERIEDYAFANMGNALNKKLAPSLWKIDPSLSKLTFADNDALYYIGKHAFDNNILAEINLPNTKGLTLDEFCFANSNKIESFKIVDGINVSKGVLAGSSNIKTIELPSSYSVMSIFGGYKSLVSQSLKTIIISDGSTHIDDYEFEGLKYVETIILPETINYVGDYAFNGCRSLVDVNISNVTYVGENAFNGCVKLENINVGSSLTYIGDKAFNSSVYLNELENDADKFVIINNILVSYVGDESEVKIPDEVVAIAGGAFAGNNNVKKITLGENTSLICNGAFDYCSNLTELTFNYNGMVEIELNTLNTLSSSLVITFVDSQYLSLYYENVNWLLYKDYLPENN